MKEIAYRESWKNFPIDSPARIDISLQFTNDQFLKLIRGLLPQQMEDKWFIFYENNWLHFHRSWTGFEIFKAQLFKEADGYVIKEFHAERNQEKHRCNDDNSDIETFSFLIGRGLLGMASGDIYSIENIQSASDAIENWSHFGNLLFADQGVNYSEKVKSALFGVAIGDALGVPVEFKSRKDMLKNPVTGMTGYGTYNVSPGTFSDDSSLTFCLAEALTKEFDLNAIGKNFVKWYYSNYWTARGHVFDIGIATRQAIDRIAGGERPDLAGGIEISSNGNGSLMRVLPLVFYLTDKPIEERYEIIKQVSSITHGHIRSVIACFYYLEFALKLIEEKDKFEIYKILQTEITDHLNSLEINTAEITLFDSLLKHNIHEKNEENIFSDGYVVHTLEASIWCLLTTDNYKDAVLKAVNLGEDSDTTGAVAGGLAGVLYGYASIPPDWIRLLAKSNEIENLAQRLSERLAFH